MQFENTTIDSHPFQRLWRIQINSPPFNLVFASSVTDFWGFYLSKHALRGGIFSADIQTDARFSNLICRVSATACRLFTIQTPQKQSEQTRPQQSLSLQMVNTEWPHASMQIVQIDVSRVLDFLFFIFPLLHSKGRQRMRESCLTIWSEVLNYWNVFTPGIQWIRTVH